MTKMPMDHNKLLEDLQAIVSAFRDRRTSLQSVADVVRHSGSYRWVGLYDVDHAAGVVRNIVWSGAGPPQHPVFPITSGLTGAAVAERRTINVGDVAADRRYLTAFATTRSEIIIPILERSKGKVIGSIDVESELLDAFGHDVQMLLEDCAEVVLPLWQRRS